MTSTEQDREKDSNRERQLAQLLRLAIDNAGMLSWEYSFIEERIIHENQLLVENGYLASLKGLPESQIADGYVAPESIKAYRKLFAKMRLGIETISGEYWFYRHCSPKDKRCLSISYTVVQDEKGFPVSAFGLAIDITDKRNMELFYMRQLESLMKAYPDALGSLLMNLTQDHVSAQNRLYSFIQQKIDAKIDPYLDSIAKDMLPEEFKVYRATFSRESLLAAYARGQNEVQLTHRYRFLDKTRWILTIAKLLSNPSTKDVEAHIFAVDITEKMLAQQIVDKLINNNYDILALIYPKEKRVDFRHAGHEFKEMPEISILSYDENRYEAALLYPENQGRRYIKYTALPYIQEKLKTVKRFAFTIWRFLNGKKVYKRYAYSYLTASEDIILSTVQDVTAIYEKEEKQLLTIQAALADAEKANAAKTAFLSNMSHDIRTPMNAIINMSKMAIEDIDCKEKALEDLDKVQVSSKFLLALINDVLDMSKINSGKLEMNPEVYPYEEFKGYLDSIIVPLAESKGITFTMTVNNKLHQVIYVDILRFNQLFFNLLSNSIKYTKPGGYVQLELNSARVIDGRVACQVVIKDNGQGMSAEFQKKMFSPFERENSRVGNISGTGLGLAIVKSTVDKLGGTIRVESEIDKGTTITMDLAIPVATQEQIDHRANTAKLAAKVSLDGKRILIAEDHPINRDIMKRLLERKKLLVDMAENGKCCVEAFTAHEPGYYDAILMDVRMPEMDGLEATKYIRSLSRPDGKTIPIIAMTANAFAEDRKIAKDIGMTAYLAKPVDAKELFLTLGALLNT